MINAENAHGTHGRAKKAKAESANGHPLPTAASDCGVMATNRGNFYLWFNGGHEIERRSLDKRCRLA
jgi:hypothetical protein